MACFVSQNAPLRAWSDNFGHEVIIVAAGDEGRPELVSHIGSGILGRSDIWGDLCQQITSASPSLNGFQGWVPR
jgi:hypothetical protein